VCGYGVCPARRLSLALRYGTLTQQGDEADRANARSSCSRAAPPCGSTVSIVPRNGRRGTNRGSRAAGISGVDARRFRSTILSTRRGIRRRVSIVVGDADGLRRRPVKLTAGFDGVARSFIHKGSRYGNDSGVCRAIDRSGYDAAAARARDSTRTRKPGAEIGDLFLTAAMYYAGMGQTRGGKLVIIRLALL
jgi:hypothetical protein